MATAKQVGRKNITVRTVIIKAMLDGIPIRPQNRDAKNACSALVKQGFAWLDGEQYWATADLRKAQAAAKMGASTPSRSRQVAGRERAKVDTSDYSGKIAARVRTLRETASMSVEDLAKKAGIDIKAMYAYEQRTRRIPPEKYPALAKALNCKTPDDFFPPLK